MGFQSAFAETPAKDKYQTKGDFSAPTLIKDPPKVMIKMWTSRDGGRVKENVIDQIDISGLYFDGLLAYDIQYEKTLRFKGLKLRDLISIYRPLPAGVDHVLLHSKAGMIIPVSIDALRKDTDVFVALAMFDDAKKSWATDFQSSVYSQANKSETLDLKFTGNKIVVGKNWRHTDFAITPWRFFDSLVGVEYVSSTNHFKTLQPEGGAGNSIGRAVYMRRCQYCHGISDFGAAFGPNFLTLAKLEKSVLVDRIMSKVTNEPSGKPQTHVNRKMPKQADFKKADAKALADWLQTWK
jgi:hypothetical protein